MRNLIFFSCYFLFSFNLTFHQVFSSTLLVINTWNFTSATNQAFDILRNGGSALDGVEKGCNICELEQCDGTVGYGGSPDSNGETTLDAMIMDGRNRAVGAVGYLRRVKDAIKVARAVLMHSSHSILVGEGASNFASMMGFPLETLSTPQSKDLFQLWHQNNCQPNYFKNVYNKTTSCPPYKPKLMYQACSSCSTCSSCSHANQNINYKNHDTIGMVAIDSKGDIAVGTSSNGANHKIAGRIGDAPFPGAGGYADNQVGGAAATGDGDIMMRFLPSYEAVRQMNIGKTPTEACEEALKPIIHFYPSFKGAIVCVNKKGEYGAAAYGWIFHYSIHLSSFPYTKVITVLPLKPQAYKQFES